MGILFFHGKKAVTPTIAIIILLFITVSAAGAAFYWLNLIEDQLKAQKNINVKEYGGAENVLEVLASRYDEDSDNLILFVKNAGSETIPVKTDPAVPTTLWVLKGEKSVICSTDWSGNDNAPVCKEGCSRKIASGELRKIVLENLDQDSLCNVVSQQPGQLIFYTIDFSGKAMATGGFVR